MTVDLASVAAGLLKDCLCSLVAASPNPPAQCCLRVGTQVTHDADLITDLCCEGLAYVRMGSIFPSANFPNPDATGQANSNCPIVSWGVELVAGIIRCVPVGGENGEMPTCADWTAAAVQNFHDAQVLRQLACCFRDAVQGVPVLDGMSVVFGPQTQGDPLGGCIERSVSVQVQIINCDC